MALRKHFMKIHPIKMKSNEYLLKKEKLISVLVFDVVDTYFLQL